ncbi:MAG: COG2426 family protein [Halanaerobiales bacterium]
METVFMFFNRFFTREWAVFFTSWLPFVELRGAIPLGISLGINPFKVFWLGVAGNAVPVIPLLLLLDPVRRYLRKNFQIMERFFNWLYSRTIRRSERVQKYGALGLIFFTAIPFPTTGAWTASFAAIIFKIKFRYAFPAIILGIFLAGIIVTLTSVSVFY